MDGDRKTTVNRLVRAGKLDWGGKAARGLRPGLHRLRLRAIDAAGNLSNPTRAVVVRVRYIEVRPHVLRVHTGARFGFRVDTDAKRYSWHLGSRGGVRKQRAPDPARRGTRYVPPSRRRERPRLARARRGEPVTSELARAGGVLAAAGLAVLIVAPGRAPTPRRARGLGAWGPAARSLPRAEGPPPVARGRRRRGTRARGRRRRPPAPLALAAAVRGAGLHPRAHSRDGRLDRGQSARPAVRRRRGSGVPPCLGAVAAYGPCDHDESSGS